MAFSPSSYAMAKKKFGSGSGGGGSKPVIKALTVTANGTYTPAIGTDGFSPVTVNVPEPVIPEPVIEPLSVTENGTYNPADGTDGFGTVTVAVPIPEPVVESLTVTENGTYTPANGVDGFNSVTVNVQASGGGASLKEFIERTVTEISDSEVTIVGKNALAYYSTLTKVEFPNAETCANSGFRDCTSLVTVTLPKLKTIEDLGFYGCAALVSANFPLVESVGKQAFSGCKKLSAVNLNFPKITVFPSGLFTMCSALEAVDLSHVVTIGDSCFSNSGLRSAVLPVATTFGGNGGTGYGVFYNCNRLTTVDLSKITKITSSVFTNCSALVSLILRGESGVCQMADTYALNGTPIKNGTGYIYVPSALVDSYKAATNWSTYAAQFRSLEDYTVDGTVTGDLDPTKI